MRHASRSLAKRPLTYRLSSPTTRSLSTQRTRPPPAVPHCTSSSALRLLPNSISRRSFYMTSKMSAPSSLRILMLHGYTQNGPLFHAKTRALEKHILKAFPGAKLVYPTAPVRIHAADMATSISNYDSQRVESLGADEAQAMAEPDAFGWWVRQGATEPYVYTRMDEGFDSLAKVMKSDGPFDGAIGFSQGGALAGMLASLLESGRKEVFDEAAKSKVGMEFPASFVEDGQVIHPPLKFAVSYSGFGATTNALYLPFYNPPIRTPMLHFLGTLDTVVEEARSLRLLKSCIELYPNGDSVFKNEDEYKAQRVVYHPGGHFLPNGKQFLTVLEGFIREIQSRYSADGANSSHKQKEEERVEDMDVPF